MVSAAERVPSCTQRCEFGFLGVTSSSAHPLPLGCCGPRSEHSQAGGGKACPTEMLRSEKMAAWLAHSILWLAILEKMLGLKDGTDVVVDKALPPVGALG